MGTKNSRLQGFYQLNPFERLQMVKSFDGLCEEDLRVLHGGHGTLTIERADKMIENVVGTYNLPLGIATNFLINGRDHLIPMVVEEPSIVAGASYAARMVREGGGFATNSTDPVMIGQIQIVGVAAPQSARHDIFTRKEEILAIANAQSRSLVGLGGGARDLEVNLHATSPMGPMMVVHLLVDTRDAMGANAINSMCEAVAPLIEQITGGRVYLRILSNLSDRRLARARCVVPTRALERDGLSGEEVAEGIMWAYAFAAVDPYRATTHNKGILNGVDPVIVATGNDWRAIEAGAHAYASRSGQYRSLSVWERDDEGNLVGTLEMPMAVGIVGGATRVHPAAQTALKLLGVKSANELAEICVAAGLASNLAAMRALACEGINRGHMGLHARQIAMAAGAHGPLVDEVVRRMIEERNIKPARAEELIAELR
ncbi:hydroxymethylglutaryl-CoA reductase, degradative [Candidatus Chloroploca sp. M-50]|uniref:3-hydroxy-3-methylglutaryl coenzyme A reductase n=1 Tax=Candidatus Chloroploca mongolica TaxID=2528176 RepID=A0ABS4DAW5_9CHLR|nr:hydroxymethylglutaryl-CoA reductase, degradative [Candidatus Chloroploca mongolica]MBP1466577.1 hydroxymethylglutaryl-CoA reductase, degradative [Candidatus Chloroploca mongolica]